MWCTSKIVRTSNMSNSNPKRFKNILLILILLTLTLSFTFHRKLLQVCYSQFIQISHSEQNVLQLNSSESSGISTLKKNDLEYFLNTINRIVPNVSFTYLNETTSGKNSKAIILDYRQKYCTGDSLTVRVDMFDYLGQRKTYGGDFLRAIIYSTKIGAGASGRIEDLNNGSYNIYFTLFWKGNVKISIVLLHPSEGVSALWKARNMGYKNILYTGKFLNKTQEVHRECGFNLESQEEKCEYADKRNGEFFYCLKPQKVPCEALISMKSNNQPHSYLTRTEKDIFTRSNIGVEIPTNIGSFDVFNCQRNATEVKPQCRIGMSPPFPSGYFFNNLWHALFCNLSSYEPLSQINSCLSHKKIYLMGDSTIRQWIKYFPKLMKGLKSFDLHGTGWHTNLLVLDLQNNVYIQWKMHGHPFVTQSFFTVKDYTTVTHEIDRLPGGPDTIIVITLGQHFRPFPLSVFIRRLLNVRMAIERLFIRSPDTKVIMRSENTREITTDVERFSDFHGYIQYLLAKEILEGLNVGVIDAWDMTTAFNTYNVHPPESVIKNQINMFLAYVC
ncbi:NXPE family member 1-like [Pelodytes ibericus]